MSRISWVVVGLSLLLIIIAMPAFAQALDSIALAPGDQATINCSTRLTVVPVNNQNWTLHCNLVSTP